MSFSLNGGFLTRLSQALGTLVSFSRAYHPSQTTHLQLFFSTKVRRIVHVGWCYKFRLHIPQRECFDGSHLRSATRIIHQQQAVVKLHGVFVSHWKFPAYSPDSEFTGSRAGTARESLCHSCKPPIKRRGITLPQEGQSYPRSLPALRSVEPDFHVLAVSRHRPLYTTLRSCRDLCF